jgi:uncharacterized Zn-finger protein
MTKELLNDLCNQTTNLTCPGLWIRHELNQSTQEHIQMILYAFSLFETFTIYPYSENGSIALNLQRNTKLEQFIYCTGDEDTISITGNVETEWYICNQKDLCLYESAPSDSSRITLHLPLHDLALCFNDIEDWLF